MSSPTRAVRLHDESGERPRVLVAGFEFEQSAFRGTSFYGRALLRVLQELGLETRLLTGAWASSEKLLERLSIVRQLAEPEPSTRWRRRTAFLRDLVSPVRARLVPTELTDDILDRVGYLRWVDACVNRPGVYDFIRIRSHRMWPAYEVPAGGANVVIAPAPIHIRTPRGVPLVAALHDLSPLLRVDHPPHDDSRDFLCRIRSLERHADVVMCSSEASRRELVAHFPSLTDRSVVMHPPVTLFAEEIAFARDATVERGVLARYGVDRGGYLLFVGVIERKKNVRRLLDAYLAVQHQLGIPLVLAGWLGYGSHEIERTLTSRGSMVRHLGYVSQLDKIVLLRNARALVFPSLYEGFGLPPIEAMQVGCPVLASDIAPVAEACDDAAHLVDCRSVRRMAEGLLEIAGDDDLRGRLCARGFRRAEQLSPEVYREKLGAILARYIPVASSSRIFVAGQVASPDGLRTVPAVAEWPAKNEG